MRRLIMLGALLVLIAAACTQEVQPARNPRGSTSQEPETSTTDSVAPTTTTIAATTTTTSVAPTTTVAPTTETVPYVWPWANEAHAYAYQSVGYSCGPDPTTGCGGDADMTLDDGWLHKEPDSITADCLDIRMNALDSNVLNRPGNGPADDDVFIGTGWGVRLVQLDAPPAGLDIGGEAWLELTVSSVSATDFAARPTTSPDRSKEAMTKFLGPTSTDPVSISAPAGTTNVVEELVLINTTDDMMQWIIALTDDQVYHHYASYGRWYGRTTLTIKINGGGTS